MSWHVQGPSGPADSKGRRVVADRGFETGEAVLSDEAYASAVISEELERVCSCGCCEPIATPLRCSACKLACFASKEHFRRVWQAGHREECAALRAAPRLPPTAVRLALRCCLRAWRNRMEAAGGAGGVADTAEGAAAGAGGVPDTAAADGAAAEPAAGAAAAGAAKHVAWEGRFRELLSLRHHWEELQDASKLQFAQMGALAHRLLTAAAPDAAEAFSPRDMTLLLARFGCNSHTVSDAELRPLAVGIFPLGAMVNHGCRPNTLHSFSGSRMLFRAVRPIAPGEEVTTAYTELAATHWERRAALLQDHAFDIDAAAPTEAAALSSTGEAGGGGMQAAATPAAAAAADTGGQGRSEQQQQQQHKQQVQAALRCQPLQQPALVVQLGGEAAPSAGELRLYSSSLPPWPHDARDVELTAVVAADGSHGGSSWGGVWGWLPRAGGSLEAAGGGVDAQPASESFDVGDEEMRLLGLVADAGAGGAAGSGAGQAVVVHCWHDSKVQLAQQELAAAQLAKRYASALALQQAVEGLLASGAAAAAVRQLRGALVALCGEAGSRSGNISSRDGQSRCSELELSLGPRHILRLRLLADLHRAAVAAGEWDTALAAARQLLPLYEFVYQPVWPQLGLLHASIAKLAHLQGHPAQALASARSALRILAATHGGGAAAEEARRVAFEAEMELRAGPAGMLAAGQAEEGEELD